MAAFPGAARTAKAALSTQFWASDRLFEPVRQRAPAACEAAGAWASPEAPNLGNLALQSPFNRTGS